MSASEFQFPDNVVVSMVPWLESSEADRLKKLLSRPSLGVRLRILNLAIKEAS